MSFDWLNPKESHKALSSLSERFGIDPEVFTGYRLFKKGDQIFIVREEAVEAEKLLFPVEGGIPLLKESHSGAMKPATGGILLFGVHATRAVAEITASDLKALTEGRSLEAGEGKGFVILKVGGKVAGMGLLRDRKIVSQLPKWMTETLRMRGDEHF
ncbi:hypothetical protein EPN96_01445 [bacterium]|nr:MAG: hypothetical protein EPN96_01445 [bacterium]